MDEIEKKLNELGLDKNIINGVKPVRKQGALDTVTVMLDNKLDGGLSQDLREELKKCSHAELILIVDRMFNIESEEDVRNLLSS